MAATHLDVDGARIRYVCTGSGSRALAFAHGWCSCLEHWDAQAVHLERAHRVLRWDRRGMGGSPAAPAGTAARHAADLVALLDACDIERTVVVGHAGGGPTALTFAADHPDRTDALILVDTTVNQPADPRSQRFTDGVATTVARLEGPDAMTYFGELYATYFGPRAAPAVVAAAVAGAQATALDVIVSELLQMREDTAAVAARVSCPVLWVSAIPADTKMVRAAFPSAPLMIGHVVGSGHFVQVEVPDQLNAMIDTFLDTLPGR